jgi:VWFA-related protein
VNERAIRSGSCIKGDRWFWRPLAVAALLAASSSALTAQQPPFVERVEVARLLVDARVFDDWGRPIPDLQPSDFAVKIDGKAARVESAEWVGTSTDNAQTAEGEVRGARSRTVDQRHETETGSRGHLVVFLVQKDLEPSRIIGLMQISQLVDELLRPLTSEDRVAIVSFDTRLRIWTDFTNNFGRVRSILSRDVLVSRPGPVSASGDVSLMSTVDEQSARRIFGIEHALRLIAESLEPLPGAKSLVLLGYGFGRFDARSGGVLLMDGYEEASAALQRARVAVFTLNVTQANYNSLQAGLQTVAAETGGMYASTYEFPTRAIERVSQALEGYYVLFVEKPDLDRGEHRIDVRLAGRKGTVIARSKYVESR